VVNILKKKKNGCQQKHNRPSRLKNRDGVYADVGGYRRNYK
jgi:hypothetical protein